MHPLLGRQLRKWLPDGVDHRELARFLEAVDQAYRAADDDRVQLERSLSLASEELYERNRRLERELEERKRLEVELQQGEKLRAVGQLAAGVAHEINTPIQFIGDSLSFLGDAFCEIASLFADRDDGDFPFLRGEIPRAIGRCRDGADRVATIVRALKTLAHPDGKEQEPADVNGAIMNTLIVVANELKYVADVELALASTRRPRCNIGEIQQVLLNLLVNAAHAIQERVRGTSARGKISVTTRDDGPDLVISIGDDGAGIPPAIRERIFEPFFTTKPVGKGTGQGLSIARSLIVDRHGGQLTFESTVGVGTTFTIRIPVAGHPSARSRPAEVAA
jgi:two-component system, NtrC family, sensor kinase